MSKMQIWIEGFKKLTNYLENALADASTDKEKLKIEIEEKKEELAENLDSLPEGPVFEWMMQLETADQSEEAHFLKIFSEFSKEDQIIAKTFMKFGYLSSQLSETNNSEKMGYWYGKIKDWN